MNRAETRRQRKLAKKAAKNPRRGQPSLRTSQALNAAFQNYSAGHLLEAERICHEILGDEPDQPHALHLLGVIAMQSGRHEIANDFFGKTLAVAPDFAEAHYNLGNLRKETGMPAKAAVSFGQALTISPEFAEAHNNLGLVLQEMGKLDKASVSYRQAATIKPDFAEAHMNLGNVLCETGSLDEAVACYRRALVIRPGYAAAHNNLGNALDSLGRSGEAIERFGEALAINPDYAEAHYNLGLAFEHLGNFDAAAASYRRALGIDPDYAEAHMHLAMVRKFSEDDEDTAAMADTYAKASISDEQRMYIAFGLGKSFEDMGNYERAFEFFAAGNVLKRATFDFSITRVEERLSNLKRIFTESFFEQRSGHGTSDKTPIFILGMPRSGTTLVEQILASHPVVYGAGELPDLVEVVASAFCDIDDANLGNILSQASADQFRDAGLEYINRARAGAEPAEFISDKMPDNFNQIGMIKLMFPNATVIHCRRDPLDTCVSVFKNLFADGGLHYAYDLSELGRYYKFYLDLMDHWHAVLPGFIYDISYEDVVADQEMHSRALLAHCGLEWDQACLEFYKTDRPIRTASLVQVRQPIYNNSIRSWTRYETELAPLIEVL